MNTQSSRFLGSIPQHYDSGLGPRLFADFADDIAGRVAALRPRAVLELAAGTGIVTRKLRDALSDDCELVASDLNRPMLDVASAKFEAGEPVRFEQVDATAIGFPDSSFDVLVCQFGVMFFPDKARAYAEALRVLAPGGSYVFSVWDSWDHNPFARITHEAVERFFPDDPPGFYKVPFGYHDSGLITQALQQAGFTRVTIERLPLTAKIPSAAHFAHGLVFGNPLHEEIMLRAGEPELVRDAVAEAIDRVLGSEMPLRAVVVHAVRG